MAEIIVSDMSGFHIPDGLPCAECGRTKDDWNHTIDCPTAIREDFHRDYPDVEVSDAVKHSSWFD